MQSAFDFCTPANAVRHVWVWLNRLEIALRCPIERLASDGERLVVLGCVLSALIGSVGRRLGVS